MISPLPANIYLHYCLDLWVERWRRREAQGDMIVVRYADDLVVGFEHEGDARRFLDAMRERLGESLHPDKTRNPIAAKLNPSTVISRGITPEKPTKASYIALVIRMKDHPDFPATCSRRSYCTISC